METAAAAAARLREQCAAESSQLGSLEDGDTRLAALLQVPPAPYASMHSRYMAPSQ